MSSRTCFCRLLVLLALPGFVWAQEVSVNAPATRQLTLDLANRLLAPGENPAAHLPAKFVDPFNPPGIGTTVETTGGQTDSTQQVQVAAPPNDRRILEMLAPQIVPSGMVVLGGQPILLFKEKRLKIGDSLPVTSEGKNYVLVVTAITRTYFKLRLNNEEVTRPIK